MDDDVYVGSQKVKMFLCDKVPGAPAHGKVMGAKMPDGNIFICVPDFEVLDILATTCHELIHMISAQFDCGLSEAQVESLSRAIGIILAQNNLTKEKKHATTH